MTTTTQAKSGLYALAYNACRTISAPEDERAKRKVYAGTAPATSVLGLTDNANVREYLVDAPGKGRQAPTLVHRAIRNTLADHPDDFSILNGGMVIVGHAVEIDDKNRVLTIKDASIVNGSQTQGELQRYFAQFGSAPNTFIPSVKFELIITNDDDLIAEISIARNFQNDVRAISIAGRRGQLDELESAVQAAFPNAKLRKSETDIVSDDGFLDTEKLIQVLFALMPAELLRTFDVGDSKVFTYSQKTRCLKLFQRIVDESDTTAKEAYRYCLDIAGPAWKLYEKWKVHAGFKGTRLRSIERDGNEIIDVPDGIVFPILASLSAFVVRDGKRWKVKVPSQLDDRELIEAAKQNYMEIADSNPQTMGKSKACYSGLFQMTSIYARLVKN
jgi:hypothetical protein